MKLPQSSHISLLLVEVAYLLSVETSAQDPPPIDPRLLHPAGKLSTVRFFMFQNGTTAVVTQPNIILQDVPFNSARKTVFLIHGFDSGLFGEWPEEMANIIAAKGNYNVFGLDWSNGLKEPGLDKYISKMPGAAAELSRLIMFLNKEHNLSMDDVHLIGHDLGAIIAANASNLSGFVGRITGIDVPGTEIYMEDKDKVLMQSDACFVDIIHTTFPQRTLNNYSDVDIYAKVIRVPTAQKHVLSEKVPEIIKNLSEEVKHYFEQPAAELYIDALRNPHCIMWGHQVTGTTTGPPTHNRLPEFTYPLYTNSCTLTSCTPLGFDTVQYPGRGWFVLTPGKIPPYCIPDQEVDKVMASMTGEDQTQQKIKKLCRDKGIRYV